MIRFHPSLNTLRDPALYIHSTLERRALSASSRSSADASLLSSWSRVFPLWQVGLGAETSSDSAGRGPRRCSCARAASRTGGREAPEEARSTGSSASLTEGHAGEFFLETFLLLRVAGAREAVGEFEETLFFLLPGVEPGLDEVGDDAAGARLARLRQ